MHPQSELENYKLQVELLQEKLHRSEDNRHELEKKLEQIMKKRNEHERTLRSRSQLKYQQFLDEQKKRNERNRKLVEMLERIDQQAAALSARSERLKMMKLQYELYFSKLVQSYATKTFQSIQALPLQRSSNLSTALRPDDGTMPTDALQMPSSNMLFNNTPQFQRVPIPMVVPISNEQNRCQPSWTFATAPPGVLIALPNNTTLPMSTPMDNIENKKIQSNFCFDYSQFPIGYLQAGTSSTVPMQYVGQASFLQQPQHQQIPSAERHTEQLFAADDDINQSKPHFEFGLKTPSSIPFSDVKTNETISNRTQSNQLISEERVCGNKTKKNDDLGFNEDKQNGQKSQNFEQTEIPMFNKDFPVSHQSLKVDKLPNIKLNNSFKKQDTTHGNDDDDDDRKRIVHEGNIPNTIDFRTDDFNDNNDENNKYIKYIKEMEETYDYDKEKRVPVPISLTPRELNIDNITTTLQVQKIQKIDKPNVGDDEKINDMDDNEKNTSSASSSAPLNGKCSIESIGDEALTFAKNKPKTQEQKHISNTASARNIDPSRDTEQITLFNGTKNSKDESTRASNRTTAIIDGDVGENKETRMDPNADINSSPNPNPSTNNTNSYRPVHFDKKEKMSIENIETAIYGELLTKPENLTSSDIVLPSQSLDNPKGNGEEYKEIEQNSQKTMGYEFTNFEKDSYEHEQDPATAMAMGREQQHQVAPYATDIEQIEAKHVETVAENKPEDYSYGDVGSVEQQQYDMQNYNYSDPNAAMQENVPQQEYNYSGEAQVPGGENYPSDYQNYDPSQYPADYDPNAYQYDYSQGQYDENNQSQYAPEGYNQEYQQDPYATGEYGNYEQVGSNEGESGQLYNEADYTAGVQDPAGNQIEENYVPQQEAFGAEGGDMQGFQNAAESYEEQTEPEVEPSADSGARPNQPTSILATDKNSDLASKKKKRVNFVDSETDESSTVQKPPAGGVSSESDFDFSTS